MKKIFLGTEAIFIKDSFYTIKTNIALLQNKIDQINLDSQVGQQARYFYERKMEVQRSALEWINMYISNK